MSAHITRLVLLDNFITLYCKIQPLISFWLDETSSQELDTHVEIKVVILVNENIIFIKWVTVRMGYTLGNLSRDSKSQLDSIQLTNI